VVFSFIWGNICPYIESTLRWLKHLGISPHPREVRVVSRDLEAQLRRERFRWELLTRACDASLARCEEFNLSYQHESLVNVSKSPTGSVMEVNSSGASPKEEGELEDGEIFDDEPQRQNSRPPRRARPNRPAMNKRARLPGPGLNNNAPLPLRAPHPPFPFDATPRSGFWERSHGALGRFRCRDWTRDWTENRGCRIESPGRKRILTPAATLEQELCVGNITV